MTDPNNGGRSSATPDRSDDPSQSSSDHPHRKRPTHFPTVESGFRSIIIFLTVCTKGRRPLLANEEAAQLLVRAWTAANLWVVGRYVILPDHLHLFCAPNTFPPQPLKNWIRFGRTTSPEHGQIVTTFRSGSLSSGIGNCGGVNRMARNGTTLKITQFVMAMSVVLRIGRIAENSTFSSGTIRGRAQRGVAELRPPWGWRFD